MAESKINKPMSYTSGTDGVWKYRKYDDGTYHAWYVGPINLDYANTFGSLWYYISRSGLTPPSFSTSVTSLSGAENDAQLALYAGHTNDLKTYWVKAAYVSELNNVKVRLDLHGKWR